MPDMRSNTAIKALFAVSFSLLVTGCILSLVGIDFIRSFGGYEHNYDSYQQTERYQSYLQTNGFTAQIEFENAVFDIINPIRYLLPWLCSLSALIAVAVLVYLLYAAGHRPGQSGIVLSTLDRMPLELFILLVAIPFILCIAFGLDLSYYVEPFIYFCLSLPLLIICTLLALLFLLGITVRLKAGGWWRYTLLYLICRTVFRFLRKTIGGLGRGIRSCALLGLVCAAAAFVGMVLFSDACAMLFLDPSEPQLALLVSLTSQYIVTLTAFFFPLALVNIVRFSIQGMGYSTFAILAGVLEMIARTAVAQLLVPPLGYAAACFASPAAWIAADLFLIPACMGCIARLRRLYALHPAENEASSPSAPAIQQPVPAAPVRAGASR